MELISLLILLAVLAIVIPFILELCFYGAAAIWLVVVVIYDKITGR